MSRFGDYQEALTDDECKYRAQAATTRRWQAATAVAAIGMVGMACVVGSLVQERSALAAAQLLTQKSTFRESTASPQAAAGSSLVNTVVAVATDQCTPAGKDIFDNMVGVALPCCKGLVEANTPCRLGEICQSCVPLANPGAACTVAGTDIFQNKVQKALPCCPGLLKVETPCRNGDTCEYCQPKGLGQTGCTPPGTDVFQNPTGKKLPCCKGLVESMAPCRGDDMCEFCILDTFQEGARAEYPPAKVSIDPLTPIEAVKKNQWQGMSLIFSDEFKDLARTKAMFEFEDIPYGVPGNTGDVNIVSIYASDTVSLLPEGGMRLASFMAPEDEKIWMQGWNGTWNTNYRSDVSKWAWHAPKVTTRKNGRFQYGLLETRIKAPKGFGPWPAAWLNGCYGFVVESSGDFLLQDDYPFLCGQYWPPELDFFEHFSPEHTWFWRPNSMSLHSPNQYVGQGQKLTPQGGYCPTTLTPPGEAWCFGVSGAGIFKDDPTERFINYAMKWDPDGVDYYMDDVFMQRFTTDQLVMYLSGQVRPVTIPEMPMFLTFNVALVRKGMDLSHGGEGLTDPQNFDPATGKWKTMAMDIEYVRVYQDDTQGETRGLNPPITYQTRRKLLANRVTCNLIPELRCMVKNGGSEANSIALASKACETLKAEFNDDYCDHIPKLCALNNAGNKEGVYGLSNVSIAQFANQRLSLKYGTCCVEEDKAALDPTLDPLAAVAAAALAADKPVCRKTPKTRLPDWLLDSEYFEDPKMMYALEGAASGLAGTNPAGWQTYGMGLPRPAPKPPAPPPPIGYFNQEEPKRA